MRRWALIGLALIAVGAAGILLKGVLRAYGALHPPKVPVAEAMPADAIAASFTTSDGLTLRGWFIPSKNGAAIILGHGHGVNRTQLIPEARILAAGGFGVLLFDWRAHGESDGALVSFGFHEQKDLTAAVDFLAARPDIARIGALGFSRGGTVLLEVAAKDRRIAAVLVEATATSLREGLCRNFGAGPFGCAPTRWLFAFEGIDVDAVRAVDRICAIAPRPVLIIHGAADRSTPVEMGRRLAEAACAPKDFWEIPGARHGDFAAHAPDAYPARLVGFFTAALLSN
jgi:dipeptidyl aminopeptidase/acylaminoacyl peptidase